MRRLLEREEIGDRTPSQFLRHLRELAVSAVPDHFLKTIWTARLPKVMQGILATQDASPLDQIAVLADKIYETDQTHVVAVASSSASGQTDIGISALVKQVAELTRQVAALQAKQTPSYNRFRNRSRGRGRNRSRSRSQSAPRDLCWCHRCFGDKARKCEPPCSVPKNWDSNP